MEIHMVYLQKCRTVRWIDSEIELKRITIRTAGSMLRTSPKIDRSRIIKAARRDTYAR